MQLVSEIVPSLARRSGDRPAVIDGERKITFAELDNLVSALGEALRSGGLRPGDRVGILLPNSLEFIVSFFGVVWAGGIVVPLNDSYQENELRHFAADCGISRILTSRAHEPLCRRVLETGSDGFSLLLVDEWLQGNPRTSNLASANVSPDSPVMFQFSSGSTGKPKRIARSHANLLFELDSLTSTLGIRPDDRFVGVAPFSHVNGLMRSMMASVYSGACLYPLVRFDRQRLVEVIEREKITVFIAVPFMFGILAKSRFPKPPDLSSLRLCVSASAPMPVNANREFNEKFGLYVRQLYGSTETGTISVNLGLDISDSLASVGTPLRGVEIAVFDEQGREVPVGETGELAVRSPAAINGYLDLEEVNREVFRGGFFFTGDLGYLDASGRAYLVGRKKFFINKGGYKINPQEIEQLLESHPGVEEAAVVGVPTQFEDEKVKAVVVPRGALDPEELVAFCRGKIADFKIPSVIEFREALPKSPTGKIRKKLLV